METDIPIPEKIELIPTFEGTTIRRTWFSLKAIPIAIFAIAWDSFLFFWYTIAFGAEDAPLMMKLLPIGHVAVGIGITYFAIASFLNKTDVTVSNYELTVKTHPLKWLGDKNLNVSEIKDLRLTEKNVQNGSSYTLHYVDSNNRQKKLLSYISEPEQAQYYLSKLQQMLKI